MKFGVLIPHMKSIEDTIELVILAEEKGYDFIWFSDSTPTGSILCRDPYVLLAISAMKTKLVKLGVAVTNPYTRHPLLSAVPLANIDEISNGRAILGIGASNKTILSSLGLKQIRPALACREAIEATKKLYMGEEVHYDGQIFKIEGSKLTFEVRKDIPVYIACRGPRTSMVAGMVADGAIIGAIKSRNGLTNILKQIKKGAKKVGRNHREIDIVSWIPAFISENKNSALKAARPRVVRVIGYMPPNILKHLGVNEEISFSIKRALESKNYDKALELVTDNLIDDWALAGTPEMCIEKIEELEELGVTQVTIMPNSFDNVTQETMIRTFGEDVISRF